MFIVPPIPRYCLYNVVTWMVWTASCLFMIFANGLVQVASEPSNYDQD